jgi:hypothetical protein
VQEILDKINNWIKLMGLKITPNEELAKSYGVNYVGSVEVADNYGYNIIIERYSQTVKISTYYRFKNGVDSEIVNSVDYSDEFARGILIAIMQMNLNYLFISKNDTAESIKERRLINLKELESIEISKIIYFDGFNQTSFLEAINSVIHAVQVIQIIREQILRKVKKVKGPTDI